MPMIDGIHAVTSDRVRSLDQWWQRARADRPLPDRRDFDPAAWKPLLPYLLLTEVKDAPFRIRYRLVGTAVVYVVGFDFTGRYLDEMLDPATSEHAGEHWIRNYRIAYERAAPVFGVATVLTMNGDPFDYSYGLFPVTAGGEGLAQFISIEDYGAAQPRVQSTLLDLTIQRTPG